MLTIHGPALPVAALCLALLPLELSGAADAHSHSPAANRPLIERFANVLYTQRDVKRAFESFVAPDYVQHNPGLPDGREAAIAALAPMFATTGAQFDVKHILVDGNLALIHLFGRGNPATAGAAVADIYRLQDGLIVEHWDVLQPVAEGSEPLAQSLSHSDNRTKVASPPDIARNRVVMRRFVDLLYRRKQVAAAFRTYAATDMIQHNKSLGAGREGSIAALSKVFADPGAEFAVQRILFDGNLAAIHYRGQLHAGDAGAAVVEVFRLESGRIVEHWDMLQAMPTTSTNAHPMF